MAINKSLKLKRTSYLALKYITYKSVTHKIPSSWVQWHMTLIPVAWETAAGDHKFYGNLSNDEALCNQ